MHDWQTNPPEIPGYTIREHLGAGGMADVFLATQNSLNRDVAIKRLRSADASEDEIKRFSQEAQLIAELEHPHIVGIIEAGRTQHGHLFYAMPLMNGGALSDHPKRNEPEFIQQIAVQICDALHAAHQSGVIHRDIKPENLLFDRHGGVRVSDFGVAKSVSRNTRLTRVGNTVGSSHYMSPEQARGEDVDGRSDLYSLGAVLFELLAGQPPFNGPDDLAIGIAHCNSPIPRLPSKFRAWQSVIDRAMSKDPKNRFADAQKMAEAISRVSLSPATGQTTLEHAILGDDRSQESWRLLLVFVAMVAAGAALFAWLL